ncbi:3'(2'),5'-bisphosphate nucleotidase CysQ family protein [Gelidibacter mesophilus]|uniref:3'(2'),5'-bisphosphate nucleotidase CysQ family protein n=1 Tax=Gelidibacter mesophilus TaxID=169050 RepID=UPI0004163825|nr:3'(2'),5'-bisphosphate nucleotidase CysQ [Gelidibacter mesophilus]
MPQTSLLKTAITAALEAGKVILDIYHSEDFEVQLKDDRTPLTKADTAAHNVIMSYLKATNIPVLSEEGKSIPYNVRKDWKYLWIVDPIDGTKEFIKRNGEFTVNIALIENQKPVLGVIFVPVSGDLYFSHTAFGKASSRLEDGQTTSSSISSSISTFGSFKVRVDLNNFNVDDLIVKALKLPLPRANKTFTMLASRSHPSEATETYIHKLQQKHGAVEVVSKGSSLKFCLIAEGQADCYPKFGPTMEWDTAAGQAICEQADFAVINWETKKPMLYNRKQSLNNWFVVQKQKPF